MNEEVEAALMRAGSQIEQKDRRIAALEMESARFRLALEEIAAEPKPGWFSTASAEEIARAALAVQSTYREPK